MMKQNRVFYFNPTCELAVANGSFSYVPPSLLQKMESDLAVLPFVFADESDFVLVENCPSDHFIELLQEAGFVVPRFCSLSDLETLPANSLGVVCPWGWSPAVHWKLKNLKEKCSVEFKESPIAGWKPEHRQLYERGTSLELLSRILTGNPEKWLISPAMTGVKVISCEEIENLLAGYSALVLKAPLSSSGRGIQIIRKNSLNTANRQWISGVLKQQDYLIAEPYLEKVTDLSFQFRVLPDSSIEYLGYSFFETNSNGQYKGTLIRPNFKNWFPLIDAKIIETTADIILKTLKFSDFARFHRGFLGVDALIFKNKNQLMMQPCVEVNCRTNMGILSLFLEKKIHPEASGKFELFYGQTGEFMNFATIQQRLKAPILKDGKLFSGFFPLTEPDPDSKFGAYISLDEAR